MSFASATRESPQALEAHFSYQAVFRVLVNGATPPVTPARNLTIIHEFSLFFVPHFYLDTKSRWFYSHYGVNFVCPYAIALIKCVDAFLRILPWMDFYLVFVLQSPP